MYVFFTVLAGICWGCISLFLRPLASAGFSSLQVMLGRAILSSVFMLIFLLIKDRNLLKIKLRDIWMFIGTGVVSLTFFSLCYFKTILEVGTSVAVVLLYTSPIFVLFFSMILFKERMTLKKGFAVLATFAGCVLVGGITGPNVSVSLKGFFIGICAGLGYALYSIFSRYALKKYNSLTVTFYTFVFSGISLIPFVHAKQIPSLLNGKTGLLLVGIALICTALPYIFYTFGLSGLETGRAAILVTIEPLVGTCIGIFIWHEKVTIPIIVGIILIFISVIVLGLPEKTENKIS